MKTIMSDKPSDYYKAELVSLVEPDDNIEEYYSHILIPFLLVRREFLEHLKEGKNLTTNKLTVF